MIPNEAINLAAKNGWLGIDLPSSSYFKWSETRYGDNYDKMARLCAALDPSFWQALGKALGWPELYARPDKNRWTGTWKLNAKAFYDLILTGGDTEAFWQELLGKK